MKPLTDAEIAFIKLTGYTASVWYFKDWEDVWENDTVWGHRPSNHEIAEFCLANNIAGVNDDTVADFLECLHSKFDNIEDDDSAGDLGIYVFRTFLTREEMERLLQAPYFMEDDGFCSTKSAKFLQHWKVSCFSKWSNADAALDMALDPHWVYSVNEDGDICYNYIED